MTHDIFSGKTNRSFRSVDMMCDEDLEVISQYHVINSFMNHIFNF